MLRTFTWVILSALLLAAPARSEAFFMTCADARELSQSADDADAVTGHSFGALDMYAGLLCFVGDAKCDCLLDAAANRPREFSRVFLQTLETCGDAEPAFGVAIRAAEALCGG